MMCEGAREPFMVPLILVVTIRRGSPRQHVQVLSAEL